MMSECESTEPRVAPHDAGLFAARNHRGRTHPGMTDHKARQPKGIPTGGQFAAAAHSEADISIDAPVSYGTATAVMATRSEHSELIYVHYDEHLSKDQISSILAGDWAGAEDLAHEAYEEQAHARSREEAEELINAAFNAGTFHSEWDELDWEDQDEAAEAIREKDTSDPIAQLLRNTPDQLMRTRLGVPGERLTDPKAWLGSHLDNGGSEARSTAIMGILKDHGADVNAPGVSEAVEELIDNGPWDWHEGVRLELIFTAPVEDMAATPREGGEEVQRKQLTFTAPRVLLIDSVNGSGHEVSIPTTVTKVLDQPEEDSSEVPIEGRVSLDKDAGGYSWDDVAGVVTGYYKSHAPSTEWLVGGPLEP